MLFDATLPNILRQSHIHKSDHYCCLQLELFRRSKMPPMADQRSVKNLFLVPFAESR